MSHQVTKIHWDSLCHSRLADLAGPHRPHPSVGNVWQRLGPGDRVCLLLPRNEDRKCLPHHIRWYRWILNDIKWYRLVLIDNVMYRLHMIYHANWDKSVELHCLSCNRGRGASCQTVNLFCQFCGFTQVDAVLWIDYAKASIQAWDILVGMCTVQNMSVVWILNLDESSALYTIYLTSID